MKLQTLYVGRCLDWVLLGTTMGQLYKFFTEIIIILKNGFLMLFYKEFY
jgi:hypothetical protein